jgi:prefoldin subunit 5
MDIITSEIERLQDRIAQLREPQSSPHATPELLKFLEDTFGGNGVR